MNFRKISWSRIITVLLLLFVVAYLYSARVKSWVIRAKLMVGFYKPHIPENKLGPAPVLVLRRTICPTVQMNGGEPTRGGENSILHICRYVRMLTSRTTTCSKARKSASAS